MLKEYPIFIKSISKSYIPIYKPFRSNFISDKQKKLFDKITDIELCSVYNNRDHISALIWYSKTNLLGGILDESIKGIRLRKENILIGDRSTLNKIFREERFNGWYQGEIFILDENIIPNARRDDFERNKHYISLFEDLKEIGSKLSKEIRFVSSERSKLKVPLSRNSSYLDIASKNKIDILSPKVHPMPSKKILKELHSFRQSEVKLTKYCAINASTKLNQNEKVLLEKTFDIILQKINKSKATILIETIIHDLQIL